MLQYFGSFALGWSLSSSTFFLSTCLDRYPILYTPPISDSQPSSSVTDIRGACPFQQKRRQAIVKMADIDADLLALAGDSSSDEGEAKETTAAVRSESPVSAKSSSPARQRSREFPAKSGVAKKRITKSGTGTRHVARRARKDDSEEEGEA